MRRLTCNRCRELVQVFEEPVEFIDPNLYVCGECMQPVAGQRTLEMREPETVRYDPTMSAWPAGF